VGVARGVGEEIRSCYPSLADRTSVIPNAVDHDEFMPAPDGRDGSEPRHTALFVGSEWEGKGLRFAIEAIARLPAWELTVVGDGDRARYENLARSLGAAGRVRFLAPTRDLLAQYQSADAFVLPSAYETFSLVTHEAAACGLPLLATRVSGVEELLEDGVNGWFVRQDSRDIAERLEALAADASRRAAMGAAAREASTRYSWDGMTDAYAELYERIASDRAAPSPAPAGAPA